MTDSFSASQPARIFIRYKRTDTPDEPDERVALRVFNALRQRSDVFLDQKSIRLAEDWGKRIEAELRRSDFLIVFLSARSVLSEMVKSEVDQLMPISA